MGNPLRSITYEAEDGTRTEAVYFHGHALTKKRDRFCQLRAFGASSEEAYREAYGGLASDGSPLTKQDCTRRGSQLGLETEVVLRIQELKRPILRKFRRKFEYTLQKALEQCEQAWDLAYAQGDPKAMLKAIELQGKFAKLLTETVDVNHRHGLLDDASTAALLEMRRMAEAKNGAPKVIETKGTIEK